MNVVELKNITKTYPGSAKIANNNISLDLRKGEILSIAGENGAGKTTLMKILCGLEKQNSGDILINGKKAEINSVVCAKRYGIGMVHQHFMLFPEYTAAENIVIGKEPRKYGIFFDKKKANNIAEQIIKENNFLLNYESKVKDLTLGEMQKTEICRILYQNANIIILDEPTSILADKETEALFNTLRNLSSTGKAIIIITHKVHEIKKISDRVAVLKKGELIGVRESKELDENEIASLMIGNEKSVVNLNINKILNEQKENVIVFDSVTVKRQGQKKPLLDKVSFSVKSGEILGFAGVGGNGLGVIEAVLGGFLHPVSGKVLHNGKDISKMNIKDKRENGLAYVPADRIRFGSASESSVKENMIINKRLELIKNNVLASEYSKKLIKKYDIQTPDIEDKAYKLSGGNLQKLILAREIDCFKDYIVFSEPTWGLDIESSRFIWEEITTLRNKEAAIILISTNLDEIIALADRIIVMYSGKIAGEFNSKDETLKEAIGNCMQGIFTESREQ